MKNTVNAILKGWDDEQPLNRFAQLNWKTRIEEEEECDLIDRILNFSWMITIDPLPCI